MGKSHESKDGVIVFQIKIQSILSVKSSLNIVNMQTKLFGACALLVLCLAHW